MTVDISGAGSKNTVKIFANIFISFIGAGVLGLPYAFKEAGLLEGIIVMTTVGAISVKAMLLLIDCKYKLIEKQPKLRVDKTTPKKTATNGKNGSLVVKIDGEPGLLEEKEDLLSGVNFEEPSIPEAPGKELTYGDVGYFALGTTGRLLVEWSIVVSQIGFCCAYLIFITENLMDYIPGIKKWHLLLILLPPLGALTLLRHLNSLALSSLFAQCSNLLAFGVVFWFDFEHFARVKIHPKNVSIIGLPFFIAVAIYCYEGAGMILSLEASVDKSKRHLFKLYFKLTMIVVTLLYVLFGSCGYLSFGPETNPIITLNLPKGRGLDFAVMVKSCLCLALFFTYPVMMFPVVHLLEVKLLRAPYESVWLGNLLRFVLVIMTGIVVMVIPNFANLMALVGASCCTLLAFILPGLFHLSIYKGSLSKWQTTVDITLILIGVLGTVIGVVDALKRLNGFSSGDVHIHEEFLTSNYTMIPTTRQTTTIPYSSVTTATFTPSTT
ncbi:uncharacterized protein LOC141905165 [Tubulanus polymorphus]|uniref:uncharacterized protein LOC141905165 n=1 Tax=Tubulanus polymorphus TaxID=672921 RepID=UPI003DA43532